MDYKELIDDIFYTLADKSDEEGMIELTTVIDLQDVENPQK